MHARISTLQGDPSKVEEGISMIEEQVIPAARQLAGFQGGYWMLDRETGKSVSVTLWESEEALRASEEMADKLRQNAATDLESNIVSVERYEVVAQA